MDKFEDDLSDFKALKRTRISNNKQSVRSRHLTPKRSSVSKKSEKVRHSLEWTLDRKLSEIQDDNTLSLSDDEAPLLPNCEITVSDHMSHKPDTPVAKSQVGSHCLLGNPTARTSACVTGNDSLVDSARTNKVNACLETKNIGSQFSKNKQNRIDSRLKSEEKSKTNCKNATNRHSFTESTRHNNACFSLTEETSEVNSKENGFDKKLKMSLGLLNVGCPEISPSRTGVNSVPMMSEEPAESVFREGRCPFCQMPFKALTGQSPGWHTMECMDIPLKATEECPADLECDSTIPSHYRRYKHSHLALLLAGQPQIDNTGTFDNSNPSKQKSSPQLTSPTSSTGKSNVRTAPRLSDSQKPSSGARSRKRKSFSQNSNDKKSSGRRSKSYQKESQSCHDTEVSSSASSGSLKYFFSQQGKKDVSPEKISKVTNLDLDDFDPVLKLLIISESESESDMQGNTTASKDDEEEKNTEKNHNSDEERYLTKDVKLNGDPTEESDFSAGCGFIQDLESEEPIFNKTEVLETKAAESGENSVTRCTAVTVKTPNVKQSEINHTMASNACRTQEVSVGLRKQTSLFSFFKPYCHSSKDNIDKHNIQKQQTQGGGSVISEVVSEVPNLQLNLERNKTMSFTTKRKPALTKSASEPVASISSLQVTTNLPAARRQGNNPSTKTSACDNKGTVSTSGPSWSKRPKRPCPFYKKIPGTSLTVDAFNYGEIPGCLAYVLTHFHYDHYQGLTKRFSQPIYCSAITANLVEKQIGVSSLWVNRLPMNTPCKVEGVWLTLMEANHCPGAVIILFELPDGRKILHTGDFRADASMEQYPPLVGICVDELYLDTTYCDPAHAFPSQKEAMDFAVTTALKALALNPGTLVVCGAYTIGKERIFLALAEALQTKVCVQAAKKRVLDCLEDEKIKNRLSLKWADGGVHVLPMKQLNAASLEKHLSQCPAFSSILAFEPTGWTHSNKTLSLNSLRPKFQRRNITVYGVPYSEHSSFLEMKRFVQFVRPRKILPTVNNGNPTSRKKMEAIFKQWLSEESLKTGTKSPENLRAQHSLNKWLTKN